MSPPEAKLKRLKLDSVILNALKLLPLLACIDILFREAKDISEMLNGPLYILAVIPTIIDLFVSIRVSAGKSLRYFKIRAAFLFVDLFLIYILLRIDDFCSSFAFLGSILFAISVILNLTTLKKYKELMSPPENKQQLNTFWRELSPIDAFISFLLIFNGLEACIFAFIFYIRHGMTMFTDVVIIIIYAVCYILVSMVDLNSKKIPKNKAAIITYGSLVVTLLMDCLVMMTPPGTPRATYLEGYGGVPILLFALRFGYLQKLQKKSKTIPNNNDSFVLNLATFKKYKELMPPPENKQQPNTFRRESTPIDVIISFLLICGFGACISAFSCYIRYGMTIFMDIDIITIYIICYILIFMVDLNGKRIPKNKAAIITYGSLVAALLIDCLVMIAPAISWPTNISFSYRSLPILLFALRFGYLQRLQKKSKTIPDNNDSSQSSFASIQDDSSKTES